MSWAVDRVHREVAALGACGGPGCPRTRCRVGRQFDGVELEAGVVGVGREAHVVEDEELGFGAEDRRCRRRRRTSHRLRPSWRSSAGRGCRARRCRGSSTSQNRTASSARRTDRCGPVDGSGIRHVGLVDRLPAGDRRAVEHRAFFEACPRRSWGRCRR
jgi:hypothetical protein